MLQLHLTTETDLPLYMQLYHQIRSHIRSGALSDGTRLPSVRSLQLQMNISKTTIETAYQMLLAEGYAISKPRSGLYVANPVGSRISLEMNKQVRDQQPGSSDTTIWSTAPAHIEVDFKPSAVDEHTFPIRLWRKMLQNAIEGAGRELCQYGDPQGEYSFRKVLAEYLRNSRGVICSPEQIIVGSGISYSVGILSTLFCEEIRHIAFEEPGYAPVRQQLIENGFELIPIAVHERGLSLSELENSAAQAVYVTPSHQFPTGGVVPYAEREQLLGWARSTNAYIIEDDYDGEFRYLGKPIPSLQGLDRDGRVIYIGTFSKAFTPALRMNYMVLPMELMGKARRIQEMFLGPSRIEQWAMQAFIEEGHWYRHIRRMRKTYRAKHQRLIELIQSHFGDKAEITGHSAGLHVQVTMKTRETAASLIRLAEQEGVRVYDFRQMWMNPAYEEYPKVYVGFGGIGHREMEKGIGLLQKAWSDCF
ncbi:MocR-like pyridoxine biosynthesis transcription factor PdxR [Brevibacillus migulae]|uniref:MocR-like pyridoxine biosynthesis transcription factor PdxR n=1 Tax=Brevibacillus migulae TaxID=1644114 RepID=UPI00106EA5D6|nr:PLP-dependent aminotransferase family protein [Brevibacillus migulae]